MSTNLTRLNVALTLSTGPFGKSMVSAAASVEQFASRVRGAMMGAIGPITAAFSTGAFIAGIKSASDRIDGLAKSADKLGISTQSLAGLRLAADESGSSAEALETAMGRLQVKVQEAAAGNKEAQKTFEDLGVPLAQLAAMRVDAQFARVADAIGQLDTQGKQAASTVAIFGKGALDLANTLAVGSAGLQQAKKDAEAMGLALTRVDAFKVEEANDAFGRIGKVIEGIFNNISVRLSPFITAIAQAFTDASIQAKGFGDVIDSAIRGAINVVGFFADSWLGLQVIWQAARVGVARIGGALVEVADAGVNAAQWIGTKFSQAWDLVSASASVLWNALTVGWAAMRVPINDFVQFVAGKMATLLEVSAQASGQFSASMSASMGEAAAAIRISTGMMGAEARQQLDKNVAGLQAASQSVAASTTALFSSVQTDGSLMLRILKDDFANLADEERVKLEDLRNQSLPSDRINELATQIQTEAQMKAEARAADLSAAQAHRDATSAIESDGLDYLRPKWMDYYDWKNGTEAANLSHSLSANSAFFGNLAKLQESHSKTAQAIGKVAAKAKIVTDTASAAMAAYSAMAGIPYVGPVLGAAAAAAAIAAGAIQLGNVDSGTVGSGGATGPADTSTTNIGGIQAPNNNQTLLLQGDSFSAESLEALFKDAKERGITIDGVRRA